MGSIITLRLGNLELDWAKNWRGTDHSELFQSGDLAKLPYHYVDEDGRRISERKEAYAKPLRDVVARVELLGFTLETARHHFLEHMALIDVPNEDSSAIFEILTEALSSVNVGKLSDVYDEDHDLGRFFEREIFDRLNLKSIAANHGMEWYPHMLSEAFEALDSNVILRLLALNRKNLGLRVAWRFADLLEGGWVARDEVVRELPRSNRFLIVTEGSSDAKILSHALKLLRPGIADFFYFVDMEEGYPFTGTGNVLNFTRGLSKIGILNNVLVVYDNDAEGTARHNETRSLPLPQNIRTIRLPDLRRLRKFRTIGPDGIRSSDINGQAASIECYLDLKWKSKKEPAVRWTSYNRALGCYQGELIQKENYTKSFLRLRTSGIDYDFSGLNAVLDCIVCECISIASTKMMSEPIPRV
jgi:HEPN/Toprim N-terminal domain 1